MTPAEFRAALATLGYTQSGFAKIARVHARTVRKWAAGDRAIPGPVVALLEVLQTQNSRSSSLSGSRKSREGHVRADAADRYLNSANPVWRDQVREAALILLQIIARKP